MIPLTNNQVSAHGRQCARVYLIYAVTALRQRHDGMTTPWRSDGRNVMA